MDKLEKQVEILVMYSYHSYWSHRLIPRAANTQDDILVREASSFFSSHLT